MLRRHGEGGKADMQRQVPVKSKTAGSRNRTIVTMDDPVWHLLSVLIDREWRHGVRVGVETALLGRSFADHAREVGRRVIFMVVLVPTETRFPLTESLVALRPEDRCLAHDVLGPVRVRLLGGRCYLAGPHGCGPCEGAGRGGGRRRRCDSGTLPPGSVAHLYRDSPDEVAGALRRPSAIKTPTSSSSTSHILATMPRGDMRRSACVKNWIA